MGRRRSFLDCFMDFDSLKILLVLYRDNPDLTLRSLERETRIERNKLNEILTELIRNELVDVKVEKNEHLYTLTETARFGFERLDIKL